jgi:hypothetical protein
MSIGLWLLSAFGFFLELLVVVAILRGRHYRRFYLVLALSAFYALVTVSSIAVINIYGYDSRIYGLLYWTEDIITHGLILFLILSLIADAARVAGHKGTYVLVLAGGAMAFALGSVAVLYQSGSLLWMISLTRNLSFCEAILNLFLWAALIQSRRRDMLLLMVSAGIGLQVTGEVIGNTFRHQFASSRFVWLPDLLVVGSEMLSLVIWLYAFRAEAAVPSAARPGA